MPIESKQRVSQASQDITGRPAQEQFTQVVARPVDTGFSMAAAESDSELAGLVNGLKEFNPHLQQYLDVQEQHDAETAKATGASMALKAAIDPADVSKLPESVPEGLNPIFQPHFEQAYKSVLGQRLGMQAATDMQAEYEKQKLNPDFNADSFLQEQLKKTTGGVTDPTIANEIAKHNLEVSRTIRSEDAKVKFNALKEAANSNLQAVIDGSIQAANGDPNKLALIFEDLRTNKKDAWSQFNTSPELAQRLLGSVVAASVNSKGSPALFDIFDKEEYRDKTTGKTIADLGGPDFQNAVAQARHQANQLQDQRVEKEAQPALLEQIDGWRNQVTKNGQLIPLKELAANIGNGKLFQKYEEAESFNKWQLKELESRSANDAAVKAWESGNAWSLDKETQKQVSLMKTDPIVQQMVFNMSDPTKLPLIADQARLLAQVHNKGGSTIPNDALKNFLDGVSKLAADPSGVPPTRFKAAVEIYKAFETSPTIRDMYFKDDADQLVAAYVNERNSGIDESTAYKEAYRGISPEAKQLAAQLTSNSEWKANTANIAKNAFDNLRFTWRDVTPWASNLPKNLNFYQTAAEQEAIRFRTMHPNTGDKEMQAHIKTWVSDNFVHDTETNTLVRVPPDVKGAQARPIVEYVQKQLQSEYPEQDATLVYMGNGSYQVQTGNPIRVVRTTNWNQLSQDFNLKNVFSKDDGAALAELQKKALAGNLSGSEYQAYLPLIGKMKALGLADKLPHRELDAMKARELKAAQSSMQNLYIGAGSSVVPPLSKSANDRGIQKSITNEFLSQSNLSTVPSSSPYGVIYSKSQSDTALSLASALVTQGEGVALRAYNDPAQGAGSNIAMGYNLNANADNLFQDFRKAGIPTVNIQSILDGKSTITAEQAQRLTTIAVSRKMEEAKKVINKRYVGLWDNLTPHEQAVVTDVAYQVKDFSKFGESIDALVSKDPARMEKAFKVHYTDRKGVLKEDTRRNNLRANMLKGTAMFKSIVASN